MQLTALIRTHRFAECFQISSPWPWHLSQDVTVDTGFPCDKDAVLRETTKVVLCVIVDRRTEDDTLVTPGIVVLELHHIRTTRIDAKKRRDLACGISTPVLLHHTSLFPGPHSRARPTLLTIRHRPDSCSLPDNSVQQQCLLLKAMSFLYTPRTHTVGWRYRSTHSCVNSVQDGDDYWASRPILLTHR